jgi:uncharacterized protein YecE (DUF72 family)
VEKPLANFFAQGILGLREKLGPILWQFPPNFSFDHNRFEAFFEMLPRSTQEALSIARHRDFRMKGRSYLRVTADLPLGHAVEIRHSSFVCPEFLALLRRQGIALVIADTAGKWHSFKRLRRNLCMFGCMGTSKSTSVGILQRRSRGGQPESTRGEGATMSMFILTTM